MALPVVVTRNQVQKTNKRTIGLTNDVVQPTTWYTCPTGKIAIIKGTCQCTSTGAAATVDLDVNGISIAEWQASGGGTDINLPQDLAVNVTYPFEAHLEAGQTLVTDQNSGSNAAIKLQATIEEFNI